MEMTKKDSPPEIILTHLGTIGILFLYLSDADFWIYSPCRHVARGGGQGERTPLPLDFVPAVTARPPPRFSDLQTCLACVMFCVHLVSINTALTVFLLFLYLPNADFLIHLPSVMFCVHLVSIKLCRQKMHRQTKIQRLKIEFNLLSSYLTRICNVHWKRKSPMGDWENWMNIF